MSDTDCKAARIRPGEVRYIKLGPGGAWESASLKGGRLDWGIRPARSIKAGAAFTSLTLPGVSISA